MDLWIYMAIDVVLMERNKEAEDFGRKLGFTKLFFKEDLKKFKILHSEDYSLKRKMVEKKQIDILLNPHLLSSKDSLHYRRSGLDHILCNFMGKNNIAMAFTLKSFNNYVEIGRLMQNIFLCRKYKVKVLFFSYAENIYEMRAKSDIVSLLIILGMSNKQIMEVFEIGKDL